MNEKARVFLSVFAVAAMLIAGCGGASRGGGAGQQGETPVSVQEEALRQELRVICSKVPCRPPTEVTLMVDEERFFQTTVESSPYVYDGIVEILPGEHFFFDADLMPDGKLENLRYVKNPSNPEGLFEVSLRQMADGRNHTGMMLKVKSPLDGPVRYSANIGPVGESGVYKTSTCPLRKGVPVMEMWRDLLLHIVLSDFHVIPKDAPDATVCK